ncbi:MAG: hypothetical protein J6Q13_00635 [Clostridia bacterium]|nr:hypothetical protein [Clostridia bacterium]
MKKLTNEYVEKLLENVLTQMEIGKVEIGDEQFGKWTFFVQLLTEKSSINNGEIAVKVKEKEVLVEKLKEYLAVASTFYEKDKLYFELSDNSFCEKLILDLIVNATNFDFNNILKFVEQRIKMLKHEDLTLSETVIGQYDIKQFEESDIVVEVEKNKSNLEGPYKFKIMLDNNRESFVLPSITFGCVDDEIYLYCIQGEKEKQTNRLAKQMDRHFRKANKGVDMEDEILSQVSVSALVSLIIFLTYQKMQGIKTIKAVNFMPLRYNSNLTSGLMRAKTDEAKQEFEEKHNRNQYNISNKFFNTIIRYAHHFDEDFSYDDISEELVCGLTENNFKDDENILYNIENSIKNYEKVKEI